MISFLSRFFSYDEMSRPKVSSRTLILLISFYFSLILNYPIILKIFDLSHNVPDFWFPYTGPVLLFFAFSIIFSILTWPYITKPIYIVLMLTSSIALYAEQDFHVLFDTSMIENVLETNVSEALFYFNVRSFLYVMTLGFLPSLLLMWVKVEFQSSLIYEVASRVILILISFLVIALIAITTYKDYASVGRNNRYLNKMIIPAHVYDTYKYLKKNYFTQPLAYTSLGDDAHLAKSANGKPTLVIMVLGETARSMNFSDNGYTQDTQPYTKDLDLISFKDVSSCGTYTALSVPCMFSNMNRKDYSKAKANAQDNVVDIIAKSGVETLWVDNDGGDKGVAHHTRLMNIDPSSDDSLCNGSTCFDEVMLKPAKQFIESDVQNKLVVLHTIGSHGPTYFQRFPAKFARFAPWCNRKDIEQCTDQEIVNVYDNTLVYTDFFLAQVIKQLQLYQQDYNVAMMYVSDHGESLGENGLYLHGTPYAIAPKEQKTVPWLLWLPKQYAQQKNINAECVKRLSQNTNFSQDNFFHSLLGLYGVETKAKQKELDIFSNCHTNQIN